MFSTITSAMISGVEPVFIHVEVDIAHGLPGFMLVGYLSGEVKEPGERVRVALKNTGIVLPPMRITVNLSPAGMRKEGTAFDLPIAVGILKALGHLPGDSTEGMLVIGELGLSGRVNPVRGVLPLVKKAKEEGYGRCLLPAGNYEEGRLIEGVEIIGIPDINGAMEYLKWGKNREEPKEAVPPDGRKSKADREKIPDFSEIKGQAAAKRAAEIAAAGFHNLLLTGPPGSGKTMIAKRIPGILPPLTEEESLEVSSLYSIAGLLSNGPSLIRQRPFMNPHHTITAQALAGGGNSAKPGMISLAHKGVLFMDELPEFKTSVIDMLRQPLEEKEIRIVRLGGDYTFPADFMLVAAMNPCPCGYYPDLGKCTCSLSKIKRYQGHISGPVLDRIDLCVGVSGVTAKQLSEKKEEETSGRIRERVLAARKMQEERYRDKPYRFNALLPQADLKDYCRLGKKEEHLMEKAFTMLGMSARSYCRILKTARTIADLDGSGDVKGIHIEEALEYKTGEARRNIERSKQEK